MTNNRENSMQIGLLTRPLLAVAGAVLIGSSTSDISVQSEGASSWGRETSFAALTLRSIGYLKLSLGLISLSSAFAGVLTIDQLNTPPQQINQKRHTQPVYPPVSSATKEATPPNFKH